MFDVHFLDNPLYKTSRGQRFFFDQIGRFSGQRLG